MLNVKGITNDQILLQIEALKELYVRYKENKMFMQCSLCRTGEKMNPHRTCSLCPWKWITGDTCLPGINKWREKNNIGNDRADCILGDVPEWNKYRMRQIKRWIKKLEEVVNGNRKH